MRDLSYSTALKNDNPSLCPAMPDEYHVLPPQNKKTDTTWAANLLLVIGHH
jgi:hypothetical protein